MDTCSHRFNTLETIQNGEVSILNKLFRWVFFSYEFFTRLISETYTITRLFLNDLKEAFEIVPLSFALMATVMYLIRCYFHLAEPNNEKDNAKIKEMYSRMKKLLIKFSLLPSAKSGIPVYIFLNKFSNIWEMIPFPMFLFEDTLKDARVVHSNIDVTIPPFHPPFELEENEPMDSNVPVNENVEDVSIGTEKIEKTNEESSKSVESLSCKENVSGSSETETDGNNYPTSTKNKTDKKQKT